MADKKLSNLYQNDQINYICISNFDEKYLEAVLFLSSIKQSATVSLETRNHV